MSDKLFIILSVFVSFDFNTCCLQRTSDKRLPPKKVFHNNGALDKATHRYEIRHQSYDHSLFESVSRNETKNAVEDKHRYILVILDNFAGLGNRLLLLISSYLLALLTDRMIYVYTNEFSIDDILCQPFPKSNWILPNSVNWKQNVDGIFRLYFYHDREYESSKPVGFSNISDTTVGMGRKPIWVVYGNQYFVPLLFMNPFLREQLISWFPDFKIASVLAPYLLHPSDSVWRNILDTLSINNGHGEDDIGLQHVTRS